MSIFSQIFFMRYKNVAVLSQTSFFSSTREIFLYTHFTLIEKYKKSPILVIFEILTT